MLRTRIERVVTHIFISCKSFMYINKYSADIDRSTIFVNNTNHAYIYLFYLLVGVSMAFFSEVVIL